MPNVNFYLKSPEQSGKSLILLQMKYKGKRLVFSTGEAVLPKIWNDKKQRVKNNEQTKDGEHNLNDLLNNLDKVCISSYNELIKSGTPAPETLKQRLKEFMDQNIGKSETKETIFSFLEKYIERNRGEKAANTVKKYGTLLYHLREYYKTEKFDFDSINLNFFYNYVSFLKKKFSLKRNSIAKDIAVLKTILNEAVDCEQTTNMGFKHKKFSYSYEEVDATYLTESEIESLYDFDLSHNKKLEQVKDLFVFGCLVGLRFGDYSSIKPENRVTIDGDVYIKLITQKTKEQVVIPCHPLVLKIFDKYKHNPNSLPKAISNQKFNDYIKDACKEAGLTETGRLLTSPALELYQCVSSHTARRSFATNLYLSGFPTLSIMKITAHKSEKAFLKYIRVTKIDAAKKLNTHMRVMWQNKLLKVAS